MTDVLRIARLRTGSVGCLEDRQLLRCGHDAEPVHFLRLRIKLSTQCLYEIVRKEAAEPVVTRSLLIFTRGGH